MKPEDQLAELEKHLRQRIEVLEGDLKLVTDLYHRAKADRDRIVSIIERVCPNSICLPAKTVTGDTTDYLYVDIISTNETSGLLSIDLERLSKLEVTLKRSKDFRRCIHLKVAGKTEISYYISTSVLEQFNLPYRFLIKEIANELAEAFKDKGQIRK